MKLTYIITLSMFFIEATVSGSFELRSSFSLRFLSIRVVYCFIIMKDKGRIKSDGNE